MGELADWIKERKKDQNRKCSAKVGCLADLDQRNTCVHPYTHIHTDTNNRTRTYLIYIQNTGGTDETRWRTREVETYYREAKETYYIGKRDLLIPAEQWRHVEGRGNPC